MAHDAARQGDVLPFCQRHIYQDVPLRVHSICLSTVQNPTPTAVLYHHRWSHTSYGIQIAHSIRWPQLGAVPRAHGREFLLIYWPPSWGMLHIEMCAKVEVAPLAVENQQCIIAFWPGRRFFMVFTKSDWCSSHI